MRFLVSAQVEDDTDAMYFFEAMEEAESHEYSFRPAPTKRNFSRDLDAIIEEGSDWYDGRDY